MSMRLVKQVYCQLIDTLKLYELQPDESLKVELGEGMLCTFDAESTTIKVSVPDSSSPLGKLKAMFFRSLLGLDSDSEFQKFVELLLPRLLAHELGHYFRHLYQVMTDDLWFEEQVANHLASALTKFQLSAIERVEAIGLLNKVLTHLALKVDSIHLAVDTFQSPIHALNAAGVFGDEATETMLAMNSVLSVRPEDMLICSGQLKVSVQRRLQDRPDLIANFNTQYTSDFTRYLYIQLGWMLLDLQSTESCYVEEFKSEYLGLKRTIFQVPEIPHSADHLRSLFSASTGFPKNSTLHRYFYSRYRVALLAILEESLSGSAHWESRRQDILSLIQHEHSQENDPLDYLIPLVEPSLHSYFPSQIVAQPVERASLPCTVDQHLYDYGCGNTNDKSCQDTLDLLEHLFANQIFERLPVDVLLALGSVAWPVFLTKGQCLIHQGSLNRDVFSLISGTLEVQVDGRRITSLLPGEVVGEISFFVSQPRSATVIATTNCVCLVFKSSYLRLLAHRYPVILMQMGRVLSERLILSNRH